MFVLKQVPPTKSSNFVLANTDIRFGWIWIRSTHVRWRVVGDCWKLSRYTRPFYFSGVTKTEILQILASSFLTWFNQCVSLPLNRRDPRLGTSSWLRLVPQHYIVSVKDKGLFSAALHMLLAVVSASTSDDRHESIRITRSPSTSERTLVNALSRMTVTSPFSASALAIQLPVLSLFSSRDRQTANASAIGVGPSRPKPGLSALEG